MKQTIQSAKSPYCIVVIPLLLETKSTENLDRILVIDAPEKSQINRIKKRDYLNDQQIKKIITTQVTRRQRIKAADDIITNDSDLQNLEQQIKELHQKYLLMPQSSAKN